MNDDMVLKKKDRFPFFLYMGDNDAKIHEQQSSGYIAKERNYTSNENEEIFKTYNPKLSWGENQSHPNSNKRIGNNVTISDLEMNDINDILKALEKYESDSLPLTNKKSDLNIIFNRTSNAQEIPASQNNVDKYKRPEVDIITDDRGSINTFSNTNMKPDLNIVFRTAKGQEIPASQKNVDTFKCAYVDMIKEDCGSINNFIKAGKNCKIEHENNILSINKNNLNINKKFDNKCNVEKQKENCNAQEIPASQNNGDKYKRSELDIITEDRGSINTFLNTNMKPDLNIVFRTAKGQQITASQKNVDKFKRAYGDIITEECGSIDNFIKAGKKCKIEHENNILSINKNNLNINKKFDNKCNVEKQKENCNAQEIPASQNNGDKYKRSELDIITDNRGSINTFLNTNMKPDLNIVFRTAKGQQIFASQKNVDKFKRAYGDIITEECGSIDNFIKAGKKCKIEHENNILSINKNNLNINKKFDNKCNVEKQKENCNDEQISHRDNNNSDDTDLFEDDNVIMDNIINLNASFNNNLLQERRVEDLKINKGIIDNTSFTISDLEMKDIQDILNMLNENNFLHEHENNILSINKNNLNINKKFDNKCNVEKQKENCNDEPISYRDNNNSDDTDLFEDDNVIMDNIINLNASFNNNLLQETRVKDLKITKKINRGIIDNTSFTISDLEIKDMHDTLNILNENNFLPSANKESDLNILFGTANDQQIPVSQKNVNKFKRAYGDMIREDCGSIDNFIKAGKKCKIEHENNILSINKNNLNINKKFDNKCNVEKQKENCNDNNNSDDTDLFEDDSVIMDNIMNLSQNLKITKKNNKEINHNTSFTIFDSEMKDINTVKTLNRKNLFNCETNSNQKYNNYVDKEQGSIIEQVGILFKNKLKDGRKNLFEFVGSKYPKLYTFDELISYNVEPSIINCTIMNAVEFQFDMRRFFENISESTVQRCRNAIVLIENDAITLEYNENFQSGITEISSAFVNTLSKYKQSVSIDWIKNNFKWIIVKFSSMERSFPDLFAGKVLTPGNVLLQLKYRYDCEILLKRRSALKTILDDNSSKLPITPSVVLFVSQIKTLDNSINRFQLELSDGWLTIWSRLDLPLEEAVVAGKIKIGTKLILVGEKNEIGLSLCANSTRRVKFDTKLGFQLKYLSINLHSILPEGGRICHLRLYILRVYPMVNKYSVQNPNTKEENKNLQLSNNDNFDDSNDNYDDVRIKESNQNKYIRKTNILHLRVIDASVPRNTFKLIVKANSSLKNLLQENTVINITNAFFMSKNKISNGKLSKFSRDPAQSNIDKKFLRKVIFLSEIDPIVFKPLHNEFDTFGIVFSIDPNNRKFESIYIADTDLNILCIHIVKSKNKYKDILKIKSVIGIKNLHWQYKDDEVLDRILSAYSTSLTTFHNDCINEYFYESFLQFKQKIIKHNLNELITDCVEKLKLLKERNLRIL